MHFDIIWLNGPSSSGKTTLAKELQALLDDHFLHVCFDTFYQMLPVRFKPTTTADSKYVERVHLGFEYSIPALAKGGNRLIVDYPFHYADSLPRCLDLVSAYRVLYVGVFSPIEVLEQREAKRGDRKIGLATFQSARVHVNSEYDVEVDTHQLSPDQAAQKIISALDTITPPTAFERLRSKRLVT
ncbi:MAG: AAA family ATPase [Verrucomicrobia bacterium]|nr:AAA family ATPase [Verrucomicrobiota bacterium]